MIGLLVGVAAIAQGLSTNGEDIAGDDRHRSFLLRDGNVLWLDGAYETAHFEAGTWWFSRGSSHVTVAADGSTTLSFDRGHFAYAGSVVIRVRPDGQVVRATNDAPLGSIDAHREVTWSNGLARRRRVHTREQVTYTAHVVDNGGHALVLRDRPVRRILSKVHVLTDGSVHELDVHRRFCWDGWLDGVEQERRCDLQEHGLIRDVVPVRGALDRVVFYLVRRGHHEPSWWLVRPDGSAAGAVDVPGTSRVRSAVTTQDGKVHLLTKRHWADGVWTVGSGWIESLEREDPRTHSPYVTDPARPLRYTRNTYARGSDVLVERYTYGPGWNHRERFGPDGLLFEAIGLIDGELDLLYRHGGREVRGRASPTSTEFGSWSVTEDGNAIRCTPLAMYAWMSNSHEHGEGVTCAAQVRMTASAAPDATQHPALPVPRLHTMARDTCGTTLALGLLAPESRTYDELRLSVGGRLSGPIPVDATGVVVLQQADDATEARAWLLARYGEVWARGTDFAFREGRCIKR